MKKPTHPNHWSVHFQGDIQNYQDLHKGQATGCGFKRPVATCVTCLPRLRRAGTVCFCLEWVTFKRKTGETPQVFFFYGFLENCTGLTRCGNLIVLEVFQSSGSVLWANYILKDRSLAHQQNNLSPYCCLDIRLGIQDQWWVDHQTLVNPKNTLFLYMNY